MTFNKRFLAFLRAALTCLVCMAAGGQATAVPGEPVRMDLSMASNGALEVAYTLPSGVTQLRFLNGQDDAFFRRKHMKSADGCGALETVRMVLRKNANCAHVMTWRVDASMNREEERPLALAWNSIVIVRAANRDAAALRVLRDPALNATKYKQVHQSLQNAVARLSRAHGAPPSALPTVLVRSTDWEQGGGGDAGMLILAIPKRYSKKDMALLEAYLLRLVVGWWSADFDPMKHRGNWISRGHTEWAVLLLQLEMGKIPADEIVQRLEWAVNRCIKESGDAPFVGDFLGDDRRCGLTLMALATGLHAAQKSAAPLSGLDSIAKLHTAEKPLDVRRLAAWADRADPLGTFHQLMISKSRPFASGLTAALYELRIADALGVDTLSERDVPTALAKQLNFALLKALIIGECGKVTSMMGAPGGIRVQVANVAACEYLREAKDVVSVLGVPLEPDAVKVWNAAQEACRAEQHITLGYADGSSSRLGCPKTWPKKPHEHWIKLRSDALVRLGITRPV
ncbi:MAG: hypothetical protein C4K60_08185 [Ideonella sp. MAG2]|nr:MAG: hypothetical protein C4K60_08185 [Ideonella sp. MAG2]